MPTQCRNSGQHLDLEIYLNSREKGQHCGGHTLHYTYYIPGSRSSSLFHQTNSDESSISAKCQKPLPPARDHQKEACCERAHATRTFEQAAIFWTRGSSSCLSSPSIPSSIGSSLGLPRWQRNMRQKRSNGGFTRRDAWSLGFISQIGLPSQTGANLHLIVLYGKFNAATASNFWSTYRLCLSKRLHEA